MECELWGTQMNWIYEHICIIGRAIGRVLHPVYHPMMEMNVKRLSCEHGNKIGRGSIPEWVDKKEKTTAKCTHSTYSFMGRNLYSTIHSRCVAYSSVVVLLQLLLFWCIGWTHRCFRFTNYISFVAYLALLSFSLSLNLSFSVAHQKPNSITQTSYSPESKFHTAHREYGKFAIATDRYEYEWMKYLFSRTHFSHWRPIKNCIQ